MEWKTYFFKVTGSTYLHYFRQNEAMALDAKPKDQIFIKRISSVEIPPEAPKNGNFVFEVHHSAGGSSPWILSADSEQEYIVFSFMKELANCFACNKVKPSSFAPICP
uniref:PH domain-containing protein n=1 Tax=Amphimedon queenslandica TaxID=400682 RepID=A0A1X7TKV6_AMPQE